MDFYSFYDRKSGLYLKPQHFPSRGDALRSAEVIANDTETTLGKFPGDFDLYFVGEYSAKEGVFISDRPEHVVAVSSLVRPAPVAPNSVPFTPKEAPNG